MVLFELQCKDKIISSEDGFIHIAVDANNSNIIHTVYFKNSYRFNNKKKWDLDKFTDFLLSVLEKKIEPYKIKTEITVEKEQKQTNE